jgi:hypothetical protein
MDWVRNGFLGFFVVLIRWESVSLFWCSCGVTVIGSSGARGGRALVEVAGDLIILLCFIIEKMGVFRSADKVRVSVFFGKDHVVGGRF